MGNKRDIAMARLLVLCGQLPASQNFIRNIAVKLNFSVNYTSSLVFELKTNQKITTTKSGARVIINNVDISALEEAKKLLGSGG